MRAIILLLLVFVAGCSHSPDGKDYLGQTPKFDIERFFDGPVRAWGIVQNRSGEVVQRFVVDIDGYREGNAIRLDERFTYQLGEGPESRTWLIRKLADGSYQGQANDIEGMATGQPYGNAFRFHYEMDLPVDDTSYMVSFDDWFFALGEDTMMNRSYIRKFGLVMAEVTIFMQKQPQN
ncbi:DUF3833 domain-containing protein [Alteromonas aestuariivivens]|uniref:DUF3833 domain-containing protein n=1 Tax=Alteromonas aestuariivivens TaxID=1938339 RepID=A0A3D8MEG4_9ALTE|nr:DUF3833 domain-containing protein [Alteromonas aestuariivivens]RDV29006.1 DUF3833 domain-containing protein [Alteromonas aestuariivivens]